MPSYTDALPTKMFEYMSAELPVIASNFPLWRDIVERHDCGMCVDPTDPAAIAAAIRSLIDAPARVEALGRAGRVAVLTMFSWPQAERELLALYHALLP
jgi:glycosyltransferase involved in cell wall biosynthesis